MVHTEKRIIVKADKDGKNWYTFSDGKKIRLERDFENLDKKYTSQVLGEVISGEDVPKGAMILFHHNAMHPVNQIYNHTQLSGDEIASGIEVFSISESECFLWKMPGEEKWNPIKGFATALNVYKPYEGSLHGILPERIKNVLYITSGELNGKVCHCLHATGLPIIFLNEKGVDETIIRLRHYEGEELNEREEIIAINNDYTEMVKSGKLLVGISQSNCNKI